MLYWIDRLAILSNSLKYSTTPNCSSIANNPYIFARKNSNKPISAPRCAFEILLKQSGIQDRYNICFHTARHSVASLMVSSGKYNLYDVKSQLAHCSIQSSERYVKLAQARQQEIGQGISDMLMVKTHYHYQQTK
ncbi:MAG: tyrosine-type recombinase/integrase [Pasteurellaceae bacterium]|nr:tyrosine-type recombinase/integrase [Pasteurellaceae bacterium]